LPPVQLNCVPQPLQLGAFGCGFVDSLTQVPPQAIVPAAQLTVHAYAPGTVPGEHNIPDAQGVLQAPQFGLLASAVQPEPASAQSA
jgi:hypothetical protein